MTKEEMLVASVSNRAIQEAKIRKDCDIDPIIKKIDHETYWSDNGMKTDFTTVDVQYSSKGYCALYEFNHRTGTMVLAQD